MKRLRRGRLATPDLIPTRPLVAPIAAPAAQPPEDDDFAEEGSGPQRRCIVTREHGERSRMIRFVLGPDRTVLPDLAAKLPGRGFWLSASVGVIDTAAKRGAFARAARGPVVLPPDLSGLVASGLARRVTDLLGLARRAGQAVGGFTKAREALAKAGLVVQASDGSDEECRRLLSGSPGVAVVRPLSASALGAVFGRDHLVHVVVAQGRLADALTAECARLAGIGGGGAAVSEVMNDPVPVRRRGDRTDG